MMSNDETEISITTGLDPNKDPAQETMDAILKQCLAEGMKPPFMVGLLTADGFGTIARARRKDDGGWHTEQLATSDPHKKMTKGYTLHFIVVDQSDDARLIKLKHRQH